MVLFAFFCTLQSCSNNSSVLYLERPELLKTDKIAMFYNDEDKKQCEIYRRVYAGLCDTTSQPYVTCYEINDKKLKSTFCK